MHEVKSIQDLLSQIDHGEILLPEFQRGYVWTETKCVGSCSRSITSTPRATC